MKSFISTVICCCIWAGAVFPAPVGEKTASEIGNSWFLTEAETVSSMQMSEPQVTLLLRDGCELGYVFEKPGKGYVLIAGDDRLPQILAFSDKQFSPDDRMMSLFLDRAASGLKQKELQGAGTHPSWGKPLTTTQVYSEDYLLKTKWGQGNPYNQDCTKACNEEVLVGCVATAMAQVMRYWKFPPYGRGSYGYYWQDSAGYNLYLEGDFSCLFDWNKMPYATEQIDTQEEIDAAANLCYLCGISVSMNYGVTESGAATSRVVDALVDYFYYHPDSIELVWRDAYSKEDWFNLMKTEIEASRPIIHQGYNGWFEYEGDWDTYGGHEFVVDGFIEDGEVTYAHINMGWEGVSDDWYDTEYFFDYGKIRGMIIGIQPSGYTDSGITPGEGISPDTGGCFVATAAYGTPFAGEVKTLSKFRDEFLLKNKPGELFVKTYYKISPRIAESIKNKPLAKKIVRLQLKPAVFIANLFVSDDKDK